MIVRVPARITYFRSLHGKWSYAGRIEFQYMDEKVFFEDGGLYGGYGAVKHELISKLKAHVKGKTSKLPPLENIVVKLKVVRNG